VTPGGPADRAGVLECTESSTGDIVLGDVIVGIDEQTIRREADLYQALEQYRPGEEVRIRLSRPTRTGRETEELRVRLMSLR
jgi:S1-C subfamily serine protease